MHSQCWEQRQRQLTIQLSLFHNTLGLHFFLFCLFFFVFRPVFFLFFFFFFFFFFFLLFIHFTAYQILVFWPGIKLMPPGLGRLGLNHRTTRELPLAPYFWLVHSFLSFFIPSPCPQAFVPLCFLSLFFLWTPVDIFLIPDMRTHWLHSIFKMAMDNFSRQIYAFYKTIMRWDLEAHLKTWHIPLVWIPERTL